MSKLLIGVLPTSKNGCSHYRLSRPYKAMSDLKLADVVFIEPRDLEEESFSDFLRQCDYLVCRPDHANAIMDTIDKYFKVKIILDTDDDLFNINPYSDSYATLGLKEVKHGNRWLWKDGETIDLKDNRDRVETIKRFYKRADIITTTTERLREKLLEYNDNVIVNPNAIDYNDWIYREIKKDDVVRIGWTGGASHYADWITVQKDIERILKEYPNVKLVIGGVLFEGIFKDLDRVEYYKWTSPEAHGFRTALMNIDIAICPLEKNEFNSSKSAVKFYEFSSLKIPTLCSNVPPYSDEVPRELLFNNLYETIKPLIESEKKRKEIGEIIYNWVKRNREQNKISKELLNNIIKHKPKEIEEVQRIKSNKPRILLTNNHLTRMGGTETWVLTMARALEKRGYDVGVFTHQKGYVSDLLSDLIDDNPKDYDLALINHNSCLNVDAKFKIFTSHGVVPELEKPIEGADEYVAVNRHIAEKYRLKHIIGNPIDTERFKPTRELNDKIRTILALTDVKIDVKGVEVIYPDRYSESMPYLMNKADLVVSVGRGALEAMSCGRPVVAWDKRSYWNEERGAYLSDLKDLDGKIYSSINGLLEIESEGLNKEISKYKKKDGQRNRDYILKNHDVDKVIDEYLKIYESRTDKKV